MTDPRPPASAATIHPGLHRLPVTVYVTEGSAEDCLALNEAVETWLAAFGAQKVEDEPLRRGSWIKIGTFVGTSIAKDLVEKGVDFIHDAIFRKKSYKPKFDDHAVEATGKLLEAVHERANSAVIDTGALLFVKTPDGQGGHHVLLRRVTEDDRSFLDRNPELFAQPGELVAGLGGFKEPTADQFVDAIQRVRALERAAAPAALPQAGARSHRASA